MHDLTWYHRIELSPGKVTPGRLWLEAIWTPLRSCLDSIDFVGKRVLDVGTWDGMWAFEAEKRGAKYVLATDHLASRGASIPDTFCYAKKALNSNVEFQECSAYKLDSINHEFDIVLCFGVLYHLRHPLLAMDQCRTVLVDGGLCLLESAFILDHEATRIEIDTDKIYPEDRTSWNAFTPKAMEIGLHGSYLRPEKFELLCKQDEQKKIARGYWMAKAFTGQNKQHITPYPGLEKFYSEAVR